MKGHFCIMKEKLKLWLEQNKKMFSSNEIIQIYEYENNNSLVVQHESEFYLGQVTARNDGFTDIEIISIETEGLVFYMHCMAHADIEIAPMFDMYINFLKRRI